MVEDSEFARSRLSAPLVAGAHGPECGVPLRLMGGKDKGVEVEGVERSTRVADWERAR